MAVVTTFKFDQFVAARISTHQPQYRHAGLSAAVNKAHHFNAWHRIDNHLGQLVFQGARCAKTGAFG